MKIETLLMIDFYPVVIVEFYYREFVWDLTKNLKKVYQKGTRFNAT